MVLNGAAGRDPRRFDEPNEFRMDRANAKEHLAFGRGPHACPGGPLARAETRISIERLLERMGDIRISESAHGPAGARRYDYVPTYILRGLMRLAARVHARRAEPGGASQRVDDLLAELSSVSAGREVGEPDVGPLDPALGQRRRSSRRARGAVPRTWPPQNRRRAVCVDVVAVGCAAPTKATCTWSEQRAYPARSRISSKRSRMLTWTFHQSA